jgi:SAM-dependent methyltransferase
MVQHTGDWDLRFRVGDTPWEDDSVAPCVVNLVHEYAAPGARVLDIGCGKGVSSLWLAAQGYQVVGCDISPEAVSQARLKARADGLTAQFLAVDVLRGAIDLPTVDVALTRGVLHTFVAADGRVALAAAIARLLPAEGIWLDVSGSADTPDRLGERERLGLPRVSLTELASAVEPQFEVLSVRRTVYGTTPGRTDFLAWASALRSRRTRSA